MGFIVVFGSQILLQYLSIYVTIVRTTNSP